MIKRGILIAVFSVLWGGAFASDFYGITADGKTDAFEIGDVRSIKFEAQKDGQKGYSTIVFGEAPESSNVESAAQTAIRVYPNPVSEYITIIGAEETDDVVVTDMQGRTVVRTKGARVDVSGMSAGSYILGINGRRVKFIPNRSLGFHTA